jgi:hypothetical protein
MRTVYDIIVFNPQRTVVACTWRSDYATNLLSELTKANCPDTMNQWTGAAMWRELTNLEEQA